MDLREQILDTATQLFRTHGLNFTMQQVASSLHISKKPSTPYILERKLF